jgi:hypothetical protein
MTIGEIQKRIAEIEAATGVRCAVSLAIHATFISYVAHVGDACVFGDDLESAIAEAKRLHDAPKDRERERLAAAKRSLELNGYTVTEPVTAAEREGAGQ